MSTLKRLIPFLLLNILVSAGAVWVTLTIWSNTHGPQEVTPGSSFPGPLSTALSPLVTTTPLPPGVKVVELVELTGAGSLGVESLLIRRLGDGELRISGWYMDDNAGHRFTFPDMVLFKSGAVRLVTRTGSSTATDLFWGLPQAVWVSGKTAVLYDDKGISRASLLIP